MQVTAIAPSANPRERLKTSCGFCGEPLVVTRAAIRKLLAETHGLFDEEADELIALGIRPAYCRIRVECEMRMPEWEAKENEARLQPLPAGTAVCVLGQKGWCATTREHLPRPTENLRDMTSTCGAPPKYAWCLSIREPTCPDCIAAPRPQPNAT
jgi:hypothetical protein